MSYSNHSARIINAITYRAETGVIPGNSNVIRAAVNWARIQVELAYAKLQNTEAFAAHLQGQLGLELHWEIGGEEYNQYKEEAGLGKYHKALGELEQLVVMHLFKLSKLAMSGTGKQSSLLQQPYSYGLQAISSVNKSARVFNGDLRLFGKQLCGTMPKQQHSIPPGPPSRGKTSCSTHF